MAESGGPRLVPSQPTFTHVPPRPPIFPDPIPNYLPYGGICMLAGATGVGKSAMTAEWAVRWRDSKTICGKFTNKPTSIGIITGDRRWSDHQKWFDKVGFGDIAHYSLRDDPAFNWAGAFVSYQTTQDVLKRGLRIIQAKPGGVVILDPMALFIRGNINDYKTCAQGIGVVDAVFREFQISVLALAHMGKQMNDPASTYIRPQDRILGSTGLLSFSDTPMYLLGPESTAEGHYEFGWAPHHAPAEAHFFKRNDSGLFIPYYDANDDIPNKQILSLIPNDEAGIRSSELESQVLEQFGIPHATFYRRLKILEGQGYVDLSRRGWVVRTRPQ